jgi:hypothetical protein
MSASSIDPDIQAAFNDSPPTASSNANIDKDILDAFAQTAESTKAANDIDLSEEGTGDLTPHQSGVLVKGAIKGALGLGTAAADLGVGPLGILKTAKHFVAPNAPSFGEMLNTGLEKIGFPKETQTGDTALDVTGGIVGGFAPLSGAGKVQKLSELKPSTAQEVVNAAAAKQSGGAAAAGLDVSQLTPETQAEISKAGQSGQINTTALVRHADAETLPMPEGSTPLRLRKGQATGDAQQISDEKNLRADPDTQGILSDSITEQDQKLVGSMGEIRRQATPDIVQKTNPEHGQAAIDAIKNQDNVTVQDIRAKYKALADANGGAIPIDTGAAISDIDAQLGKKFLTKTAANNGVVSSVMDSLRSGKPIDFETFENARTGLAAVQRAGGSDGVAAGIVHDALEKMPLSAEAAPLKGLADQARAAAKARFDTIRLNPAYKAAIEDNVPKDNGLHVIGAPSPLADSFMDRYALGNGPNASKAYIQRLKSTIADPTLSQSIEAATLNKLRDSAGIDSFGNGSFRNASYRNARNALEPKADVLLSPESKEATDQLKRVSGYVNDEGKASTVNRSNTALTLQRFGAPGAPGAPTVAGELTSHAGDVAAGHLGPVALVGKKIGETVFKNAKQAKDLQAMRDAKLKFAEEATKPGAGIIP